MAYDTEKNYRALGYAIVIQTVRDYKKALLRQDVVLAKYNMARYNAMFGISSYKKFLEDDSISKEVHALYDQKIQKLIALYEKRLIKAETSIIRNKKTISECERFFYTREFEMYSGGLNGPRALRAIKEQYENGTLSMNDYVEED